MLDFLLGFVLGRSSSSAPLRMPSTLELLRAMTVVILLAGCMLLAIGWSGGIQDCEVGSRFAPSPGPFLCFVINHATAFGAGFFVSSVLLVLAMAWLPFLVARRQEREDAPGGAKVIPIRRDTTKPET
jgi:hypothetical protein